MGRPAVTPEQKSSRAAMLNALGEKVNTMLGHASKPKVSEPPTFAAAQQQIADAQRRIAWGVRDGTILPAGEKALQSELDALQKRLVTMSNDDDGFTKADGQAFSAAMDGLNGHIKTRVDNLAADYGKRISSTVAFINERVKAGSLTEAEAAPLLERAAELKENLTGARWGSLSDAEKQEMKTNIDALVKDMKTQSANGATDLEKRYANFEQRINDGAADGTLSETQVASLGEGLAQLKRDIAGLDEDAPGYDQDLAKLVNAFDSKIWKGRHDLDVSATKLHDKIEDRIESGVTKGKFTPRETEELKAALEAIMDMVVSSSEDAENRAARLNALNEKVTSMLWSHKSNPKVAIPVAA
jgi:hypothetical protein